MGSGTAQRWGKPSLRYFTPTGAAAIPVRDIGVKKLLTLLVKE